MKDQKAIELFFLIADLCLADGKGYGHTLSGLRKPVADSSRGASVDEIVGDIAMVIIAAANN